MWFPLLLLTLGVLIAAGSRLLPGTRPDKGSGTAPAGAHGKPPAARHGTPVWYHVLTLAFILFGMLAIFSVGMAFLFTGMMLAILGPFRLRAAVFWPPLIAWWTFITTLIALAPFSCSQSASTTVGQPATSSPTVCTNLVGINYSGSGTGSYNPPLMPALLIGLVSAIAGGLLARALLRRREKRLLGPGLRTDE